MGGNPISLGKDRKPSILDEHLFRSVTQNPIMNVQNRSPIRFRFDEAKATQVAMRLLEKSENRLSHLALMKMLYIIDREALARWERPVIGGRYCSMEPGAHADARRGRHR